MVGELWFAIDPAYGLFIDFARPARDTAFRGDVLACCGLLNRDSVALTDRSRCYRRAWMSDSESSPKEPRKRGGAGGYGALLKWALVPLAAFLVLTGLILATGTPSSADLMKQATNSFGQVNRGVFSFAITITPTGTNATGSSTIKLAGPFELVQGKQLPKARIKYTISAGGRSQVVDLLMTGDKAYTISRGQAYELPASVTKNLKQATTQLSKSDGGKQSGLTGLQLNFSKWLIDPLVGSGSEIDGIPTWRTRARVNVVAALQDLTGSARALGGVTGTKIPALSQSDLSELRKDIKNARVEVFVGRYDRIVRKIDLTMDFVTPSELTAAAGGIAGGRLNVKIGIARPNQPTGVKPPQNPLPFKALQSLGSGGQSGTALDDGLGR